MNQTEKEFLEELRRDFVPEAEEYLQTMISGLLDLEKKPVETSGIVEEIFRAAHSLKGAAQAVQMPNVSSVCQVVESVFSGMKKGILHLSVDDFDTLQRAVDALSIMLASPECGEASSVASLVQDIERVLDPEKKNSSFTLHPPVFSRVENTTRRGKKSDAVPREQELLPSEVVEPMQNSETAPSVTKTGHDRREVHTKNPSQETVRIAVEKLDSLLLKAEELISVNLALAVRMQDVQEILEFAAEWRTEWERTLASLQREGQGVSSLSSKVSELLQSERSNLRQMVEKIRDVEKSLRADQRATGGLIRDLLEGARTVLMLPFSSLFQSFPKIVRDLSKELGKEAKIVLHGGDIEVDKRILEGLKDPLVHIVRNCLDHGLENADERTVVGKPASGTVTITVSQMDGSRVELLVTDDGRGIDPAKLRESAIKAGTCSREEAATLDDPATFMLIFKSGVSTSSIITDISGRGLGMAIVQEGVEALGGSISVESAPGKGTEFRLSLPLSLATFRGVLVEEWGRLFVIPSASVEQVARVEKNRIKMVEQRETVAFNGAPLALARLGQVLELSPPAERPGVRETPPLIVVGSGSVSVAFGVDRVLNEQEVLLKPLGKQLGRVRNISGATVLGSGRVVPVLNATDLIRSVQGGSGGRTVLSESEEKNIRKSVLVAEDSITSRTLIRNILTAAGFDVQTTVDGQEAWEALSKGNFDIVISDVEMPRMNGFELTARIRSESAMADIPIILVTSLESREDRERGAEAGADAYIVKSGFDQGNLLDVMRRLL